MKLPEKLNRLLPRADIDRTRMVLALAMAVAADGLQLLLGPLAGLSGSSH